MMQTSFALLCFFSMLYPCKAKQDLSHERKILLENFFDYLSALGNHQISVDKDSLESFISKNCFICSNGDPLSRRSEDFVGYLQSMQKKYEHVEYFDVLEDLMLVKEEAFFRFKVRVQPKKIRSEEEIFLEASVKVSFSDGKIISWNEIVCETFPYKKYPISSPRTQGYLQVSDLHSLFYATYGNRKGIPVVVLHGGPGEGCHEVLTSFFDLRKYFLVMFDQRGSGRSIPFGCLEENTPGNSVHDIEKLRKYLNIEKWLVFGGSWGATLALLYGQSYPQSCLGFVLRGIFLGRKKDYLHLFYGMGALSPKAYDRFLSYVPKGQREDLLSFYYDKVMSIDPIVSKEASLAFMEFDTICARFYQDDQAVAKILAHEKTACCIAKHFMYYAKHGFFLEEGEILQNMDVISHLPAIIIHGKHDIVTLPENAYTLHKAWPSSALWIIPNAGHTSLEPHMRSALIRALNLCAEKFLE